MANVRDNLDVRVGTDGRVRVSGELDLRTAPSLVAALSSLCRNGVKEVQLDLSSVSFIDSSGMNALVCAERNGLRLHLAGSSPTVDRVLEIGGLLERWH